MSPVNLVHVAIAIGLVIQENLDFARGVAHSGLPAELLDADGVSPVRLVVQCGFCETNGQARRLIAEGGIRINGKAISDPHTMISIKNGDIVQRGKRKFVRLVVNQANR